MLDGLINLIVLAGICGLAALYAVRRERARYRQHLYLVRRIHGASGSSDKEAA